MLRIRTTFFGSGSDLDVWKQILIKNLTFELIWLIWIKNVLVKFKKCKLFNKYVFLIYYIKFSFYTFFGRNRIQTIVSDPGKRFGSATLAAGIGRIIPGPARIPDRTGTYCRLKIVKTTIFVFFPTSFKSLKLILHSCDCCWPSQCVWCRKSTATWAAPSWRCPSWWTPPWASPSTFLSSWLSIGNAVRGGAGGVSLDFDQKKSNLWLFLFHNNPTLSDYFKVG